MRQQSVFLATSLQFCSLIQLFLLLTADQANTDVLILKLQQVSEEQLLFILGILAPEMSQ